MRSHLNTLTLILLATISISISPAALAQGPPCKPCAGLLVDDPALLLGALESDPVLEGEARLYIAWNVDLKAPSSSVSLLEAVDKAGGTPWLRLRFRTPSPILENAASLARELSSAAELARSSVEGTHFQILWAPPAEESWTAEEYAFLLKRASVVIVGAKSGARIISAPLKEHQIAPFYAEETAAYIDGLALYPSKPAALKNIAENITRLDPGRSVIIDGAPFPADPWSVLADAARFTEGGAALTLFAYEPPPEGATAAALAPIKLLAREFQGDLSLDPYSVPTGAQEAWSFVRGEDLSLRVITRNEPGATELKLLFPDTQLKRPARLDPQTGEAQDLFGQSRTSEGLRLSISNPTTVTLLRLERMTAEEIEGLEGLEESVTVADRRQMPVEEILRRLQAFDDAQNRRVRHYRATNTTHLRFQFGTGVQGLEATFEGDFFFRPGQGFDWAWQTFYVNGVRWRGKSIPEIPLVQPEKAAALPLEINFTKEYSYRLRGAEVVEGRDCWIVDFSPAVEVDEGRTLYQGTVWVDRQHFGRVRTRALQVGLEGEVLSNEETVYFTPTHMDGTPGSWDPESLWLPLRIVGQQLLSVLNATTIVEKETLLTALEINGEDFEAQRQAILESDVTMVRDTDQGWRYLVKDEDSGERKVQEDFRKNRTFAVAGVFWDESRDFPLPLGGIDYFSFDYKGTGKQVNLFFAGVLLIGNVADPDVFGSKWDAGASVFALAVGGTDSTFRDGIEREEEDVESRPARFSLFLGRPLGSYGKLDLTYSLGRTDFSRADDTADEFVLPQDHFTQSVQLEAKYNRSGYRFRAAGSVNRRSDWQPWGLPGSPELEAFDPDTEEYTLWNVAFAKTWWLPRFKKFSFELEYLDGEHLDRFSKYQFGFFADSRIHGYQSDRVRAEDAIAAHLSYGFEVGELFRLQGIGDVAIANDEGSGLEDELLAGIGVEGTFLGPWQTIVNLDLGFAVDGPDDGFTLFLTFLKLFK